MNQFSIDDLYLHKKVTELHCFSGGYEVAAGVLSIDREANQYISNLWIFPLVDCPPRQLTQGIAGQRASPITAR
jgi:hypothetical protein